MITLSLADYAILVAIIAVVVIKTVADIRDVKASRAAKRGLREIAKRSFLPKLTLIILLESVEDTKRMLHDLESADSPLSAVIVVGPGKNAKDARALRYYIDKHAVKHAKVVTRKQPNFMKLAGEQAKSGLVAVLPDTVKLTNSFYWDNILPFGDAKLDALVLASYIRPNNAVTSGIEVLFSAWRRYLNLGESRIVQELDGMKLPEGVIIRAKHSRRMPKRPLQIVQTRKPGYSIAAQKSVGLAWLKLQKTARLVDFVTVFIMTICGAFLLQVTHNFVLVASIFTFLYGALVWWSLGAVRISLINRISVLLLSPFLYVVAWSLVIARSARLIRGS